MNLYRATYSTCGGLTLIMPVIVQRKDHMCMDSTVNWTMFVLTLHIHTHPFTTVLSHVLQRGSNLKTLCIHLWFRCWWRRGCCGACRRGDPSVLTALWQRHSALMDGAWALSSFPTTDRGNPMVNISDLELWEGFMPCGLTMGFLQPREPWRASPKELLIKTFTLEPSSEPRRMTSTWRVCRSGCKRVKGMNAVRRD